MRPTALVLNLFVATIVIVRFAQAGHLPWRNLVPLAIGSVPVAFLGGSIDLPGEIYRSLVAAVLLVGAWRLATATAAGRRRRPPGRAVVPGMVGGAAIGLLAGLTGTGGGIFLTPLLVLAAGPAPATPRACRGVHPRQLDRRPRRPAERRRSSCRPRCRCGSAPWRGGLIGSWLGAARFSILNLRRALAFVLVLAAAKLVFFPDRGRRMGAMTATREPSHRSMAARRCAWSAPTPRCRSSPARPAATSTSTTPPRPRRCRRSTTPSRSCSAGTRACTAAPASSRAPRPPPTRARASRFARFVNARDDDAVIITRNTTDSINLLAGTLPEGTHVVAFAGEHHANLLPWKRIGVRYLPVPESPAEMLEQLGDHPARPAALRGPAPRRRDRRQQRDRRDLAAGRDRARRARERRAAAGRRRAAGAARADRHAARRDRLPRDVRATSCTRRTAPARSSASATGCRRATRSCAVAAP